MTFFLTMTDVLTLKHAAEMAVQLMAEAITAGKQEGLDMDYDVRDADIQTLKEAGISPEDIDHCVRVARKALEIARRVEVPVDLELVSRGALFHDLGKAKTHEITHGMIGAELGRGLGLPEPLLGIMEKHVRGGLTPEEARELGLPVKDYTLKSLEERIVIYADRLVDILTDPGGIVSGDEEAEARFEEILTSNIRYGKNAPTLARYLGYHREIQGLMRKT